MEPVVIPENDELPAASPPLPDEAEFRQLEGMNMTNLELATTLDSNGGHDYGSYLRYLEARAHLPAFTRAFVKLRRAMIRDYIIMRRDLPRTDPLQGTGQRVFTQPRRSGRWLSENERQLRRFGHSSPLHGGYRGNIAKQFYQANVDFFKATSGPMFRASGYDTVIDPQEITDVLEGNGGDDAPPTKRARTEGESKEESAQLQEEKTDETGQAAPLPRPFTAAPLPRPPDDEAQFMLVNLEPLSDNTAQALGIDNSSFDQSEIRDTYMQRLQIAAARIRRSFLGGTSSSGKRYPMTNDRTDINSVADPAFQQSLEQGMLNEGLLDVDHYQQRYGADPPGVEHMIESLSSIERLITALRNNNLTRDDIVVLRRWFPNMDINQHLQGGAPKRRRTRQMDMGRRTRERAERAQRYFYLSAAVNRQHYIQLLQNMIRRRTKYIRDATSASIQNVEEATGAYGQPAVFETDADGNVLRHSIITQTVAADGNVVQHSHHGDGEPIRKSVGQQDVSVADLSEPEYRDDYQSLEKEYAFMADMNRLIEAFRLNRFTEATPFGTEQLLRRTFPNLGQHLHYSF